MRNNNHAIVKKLTNRSLASNKKRNFYIIAAIMLTAFMITSVFSVSMSIFESLRMQIIRLEGSMSHAGFPFPSVEQLERLSTLEYIEAFGMGNYVGVVNNTLQMGDINLNMAYFDESLLNNFHKPAWTEVVGAFPEKENEIMASRWVLEKMGIDNPEIGMTIPLSFTPIEEEIIQEEIFILSGYYTSFDYIRSGKWCLLLVSKEFSQHHGKTVQNDGSVNILFKNSNGIGQFAEFLKSDLGLTNQQPVITSPVFDIKYADHIPLIISLALIVAFLMFTGYLLIYNVLYISVSRDVRFFGLLKTIGTTPKQMRRIVTGQIMRLCVVGIPVGVLLGALVSLVLVPTIVLASDLETGMVISFSPYIFIGAAIFSMITALVGAIAPAKKAARISAVEAAKYTSEANKKNRTTFITTLTHGKPYRMAIRNIFRDHKRALVVFLSLFLGVTTFITATTIVSSIDIDKYTDSYLESDFILENHAFLFRADITHVFDQTLLEQIQNLPDVEEIQLFTQEPIEIKYTPEAFEPHISWLIENKNEYVVTMTKEQIENNFVSVIFGIDKGILASLNETFSEPIDIEAFERGEFALIVTDEPYLYENVDDLEITCMAWDNTFSISLGGFVPYSFRQLNRSPYFKAAPTVIVSNSYLKQLVDNPLVSSIHMNVANSSDKHILTELKKMTNGNYNISIESRIEARQGMEDAKRILYILGGGVSVILGMIGILNFVNLMSVGIITRRREFATLESIGMLRKQMRLMLISEGLGYAIITLALVLIIGNGIVFGLYTLLEHQVDYMTFAYPVIPVLITYLIIMVVCVAASEAAYHSINKSTIIERLREAE